MFSGNERLSTTNSSHHHNSTSEKLKHKSRQKTPTHPLLIHKLLYTQRYDHQQCLYALSLVSIVLKDEGRAFICSAATTSMSVCNTPHQSLLRELLIRHRRALSGNEFYGSLADGKNAFFFFDVELTVFERLRTLKLKHCIEIFFIEEHFYTWNNFTNKTNTFVSSK